MEKSMCYIFNIWNRLWRKVCVIFLIFGTDYGEKYVLHF